VAGPLNKLTLFSVTAAIGGKMSGRSGAGDRLANNMLCALKRSAAPAGN
jgi:hypothetical protein